MALEWSSHMRLGIVQVDDAHQLFIHRLRSLERSTDHELLLRLSELLAGMERGFLDEEALMQRIGLPHPEPHRQQHARIVLLLRQALAALQHADTRPARDAIALLPHWFLYHLSTQDLELSVATGIFAPAPAAS